MNPNTLKKIYKIVIPIIALIAISASIYLFIQIQKLNANPQEEAKKEATELIAKVGELMVLPVNEIPTVATVSDLEKLKDQPFFTNAQKGDKVLIYAQSKKAILYSPTLNKIIEVAPLNIGSQKAPTSDTSIQETPTPATSTPTTTPTKTIKKKK